jgi:hypothetical protein
MVDNDDQRWLPASNISTLSDSNITLPLNEFWCDATHLVPGHDIPQEETKYSLLLTTLLTAQYDAFCSLIDSKKDKVPDDNYQLI